MFEGQDKHAEYTRMLKQDLHYVEKQIELWESKVQSYQVELDKWTRQKEHLDAIRCRCELAGLSAYSEKKEYPVSLNDRAATGD